MAGVDKIIGEILEEAEKAANENRQEAQKKADAILEDAKKECAKAEKETDQKIEAAKKSIEQRAKSSAQLKKRQEILKARQQIISEILDKSYQHIFQMGEQEYFALLEKMLRKFALPKDGEIHFSKTDLERMPSGFGKVIEDAADKMAELWHYRRKRCRSMEDLFWFMEEWKRIVPFRRYFIRRENIWQIRCMSF